MKLSSLFLILTILISGTLFAQQPQKANGKESSRETAQELNAKVAEINYNIIISPNPLPKENAVMTITPVNIEIYSYVIVSSSGQIVELENLSGRPDPSIIDLSDAVTLGTYIIRFDTNFGMITRKFVVI